MELLYRGFDGLDVSFQGQIDPRFCTALEAAKLNAQKFRTDEFLEWRGIRMLVAESGARGGYAFMVRSDNPQANWFFKKPHLRDPWGIRVSCSSFQLASHGFGATRAAIIAALEGWGINIPSGSESIGRVDYAMDFLAPDLILNPDHFVMHSNCSRADHHAEIDMRTQGKSGRVTSVTVGKMPGRQVIVYDKRAEIIARGKLWWQTIWDAARKREGMPPLEYGDPISSRVWRVEVRAGKKHLKDTWAIHSWGSLDDRVGDVFARSLEAVRLAQPIPDTNRSRWPDHPLWLQARQQMTDDLFEMRNFADPDRLKQVHFDAYDQLLAGQIKGLTLTRAALNGLQGDGLGNFVVASAHDLARSLSANPSEVERRLRRTSDRLMVKF
jgi:hypothetical protein